MSSLDWTAITGKKNLVKSSDQKPCGNIIAEYNDNIFVIRGETVKSCGYMIPKSKIDHYDGKELFLDVPYDKLTDFHY
jgi:hypothetical protein